MKRRKIWAALLAVVLLAALAACGSENKQAADKDFKFMQGERVSQADIDFYRVAAIGLTEGVELSDAELLHALAMLRAVMLEAESQNMAVSWEDAYAHAETQYQEWQKIVTDESNPDYYMAKWMLEYAQQLIQTVPMTEDDYLDYLAFNQQATEDFRILREQFAAGLPVEVQQDEFAFNSELYKYTDGLIEKYRADLVEDDLLPLLDEYYANN